MRIGFPVWVKTSEGTFIVNVFMTCRMSGQGLICVEINGTPHNELSPNIFPATVYLPLITDLLARNCDLTIQLEGGTVNARQALFTGEAVPKLDFQGLSGTLAVFVLRELADQITGCTDNRDVLISGSVLAKDRNWTVSALGNEQAPRTREKADAANTDLWLHREDVDLIEVASKHIIPFDARTGSPAWLLYEFCGRYGLKEPATEQVFMASAGKNERDLFEAAIHRAYFEDPDGLEKALDSHFGDAGPRALLPIQLGALEKDRKKFIFKDPERGNHHDLRNVTISGPTGCGKTTLLHALVLNGLHNRGGGVLYIGPVKALVEEFHATVTNDLKALLPAQKSQAILLSTGDYSKDDSLISQGRFGLACMVNEKANVLFSSDNPDRLMRRLTLVIIDEIHMLRDQSRGGVLDLLITKAAREAAERYPKLDRDRLEQLQIVVVSTEAMADVTKDMPSFLSNPDDPETVPVSLHTDQRPVPVRHRVAVIYEQVQQREPNWVLRDIVCFSSDADRKLDFNARQELLRTLGPHADERTAWDQRVAQQSEPRLDKQIQSLIVDRRQDHQSIIVALRSIELTISTANALEHLITHKLELHQVPPDFEAEVKRAGLPPNQTKSMISWARRGIFVHNSQLPRRLRARIEKIFRERVKPNSRPKVLLTTETLTYGVNLSATCVILTSLMWARDDPMDPFSPPATDNPLDPNNYHNLLGRAGRKGLMPEGESAEAIICIPISRFQSPKSRDKFLEDYYAEPKAPMLFSSIAQPGDLARIKAVRDRSREKSASAKRDMEYTEKSEYKLSEYSFSAFRSMLDALRTAGNIATRNRVQEVVKGTTVFQACDINDDRTNMGKLLALSSLILEKASSYEKGEIRLVTRNGEAFSITPEAEALIDTGTSLLSVEPVGIWLALIRKLPALNALSVEAVLPGLIAAPDFTKIACELVPGSNLNETITPTIAKQQLESIRAITIAELDLIGAKDLGTVIDDFLKDDEIIAALRLIPVAEKRAIIFWQLLCASLRWLRGCPEDEIRQPLKHFFPAAISRRWLPKHADRLEQLAMMCYRFFSRGEGFLTEQQKLKLPQLAMRLKHGIPFTATPYLNVFSSDGILPREAVVSLHNAENDPFKLLAGRAQDVAAIQRVVDEVPCNVDDAYGVIRVVGTAYGAHTTAFLNSISQAEAGEYIDAAAVALDPEGIDRFLPKWNAASLLAVPLEEKVLQGCGMIAVCDAGGRSLQLDESATASRLRFVTIGAAAVNDIPTIQLLGWHEIPSDGWSITPCAFVLVISLLVRRCVSIGDLVEALSKKNAQRISVYWIASELWAMENLKQMPVLREELLGFAEPLRQWGSGDEPS